MNRDPIHLLAERVNEIHATLDKLTALLPQLDQKRAAGKRAGCLRRRIGLA